MDVLMQLNALGCSEEVYRDSLQAVYGLFLLKMAKATNIFLFKFKYIQNWPILEFLYHQIGN